MFEGEISIAPLDRLSEGLEIYLISSYAIYTFTEFHSKQFTFVHGFSSDAL